MSDGQWTGKAVFLDPRSEGGGKRLAPRPDGPLTHFASPRGETCRLPAAGVAANRMPLSMGRSILIGAATRADTRTADCPAARGKSLAGFKRRGIPAEQRCSSVEYVQYAPWPRLVSQAQRRSRCYAGRSRCYAGFHHGLPVWNRRASRHNAASPRSLLRMRIASSIG